MAEREALQKRYAYQEMSNKVEQADRSLLRSVRSEPTGEVESLRGRKDIGRMGDRAAASTSAFSSSTAAAAKRRPAELEEKIEKAKKRRTTKAQQEDLVGFSKKSQQQQQQQQNHLLVGQSILDVNLTGYQPTNPNSRAAYESLLKEVSMEDLLGAQPADVIRDAVEEVISILKDEQLRDPERHYEISKLLTGKNPGVTGGLSSQRYAQFVGWSKKMTDYHRTDDTTAAATTTTKQEDEPEMNEEMGVAVVFDESEEDRSGDEDVSDVGDEVVDVMSSSDEEDEQQHKNKNELLPQAEGMEDVVALTKEQQDVEETKGKRSSKNSNNIQQQQQRRRGLGESTILEEDDTRGFVSGKKGMGNGTTDLTVHDIDAHWLQRQLSATKFSDDVNICAKVADDILNILEVPDTRECENKLLLLLGFDLFEFIKLLLSQRLLIWACIKLKRARDEQEKQSIEDIVKRSDPDVWDQLYSKESVENWTQDRMTRAAKETRKEAQQLNVGAADTSICSSLKEDEAEGDWVKQQQKQQKGFAPSELDLDSLAFHEGGHLMSNKKCDLPEGSWRAMKKGYEEVHVPAIRSIVPKDERLIEITDLPPWTHAAFEGMDKLNRVQSKMYEAALYTSENLLLCAPTGAGKTNVAMLAVLNTLAQFRRGGSDDSASEFDLQRFKIVYVAPMKALVQEVVKNFGSRLSKYGITVKELSGDASLTREAIQKTQMIVTTPEKWDIVTRQGEGRAYTQLVKLIILDEIHLLHDDRGPVLENLVSRTIRQVEETQEPVRLVGLSATLPNYGDVADFLRVKPSTGLFFFDHSYRPVPLQQQYIGITEKNAFKRFQIQNEICYERCLAQRKNNNQVLIFVHSRAECGKTAKALRDMALEKDELNHFIREGGATQEILREELPTVKNADLKDVLPYSFAVHHAGMCKSDRELVEDLFADRHIAVLCCTATLAWGVNLPAHAVIIKGTQIYDPKKGRWAELSPLDILQMLGRAGRPQYDSEGEGIIMTAHSELQYYLSLMNLQLPVESQLIKSLPDHLNAEIVLGNVQTVNDAVDWLSYSFLFVRMLRNPSLYGIQNAADTLKEDPKLTQYRMDLVHTAACILEKNQLTWYDRKSGALQPTALGRISSLFYISHSSMALYSQHLRPNMSDIELLRLFSLSGEFAHITVREDEKLELSKLINMVPIPVKESPFEPSAKVNILLQAYISRLKLEGFALMADMAFIQQSAARIMRALFEIALKRNWAQVTKLTLDYSNMIASRLWKAESPLRQFPNFPPQVARKLERKSDIEWSRYFDLPSQDLGELVGVPKLGKVLHKLVHQFPRLDLSAIVQPITRSLLRVDLTLTADFQFDVKVHGYVQLFHIIVEDVNGAVILHHELFILKSSSSEEEHVVLFFVPVLDPLPPQYFIRVFSDRWLHSKTVLPISFQHLILPAKFPPPTELLDLQPLPLNVLGNKSLTTIFECLGYRDFNPVQTQTFHELFKTDRNVLVSAPNGSGKTVLAEFAILRMLTTEPNGKCIYLAPNDELAFQRSEDWKARFESTLGVKIKLLTGEATEDLRLLTDAQVAICTVSQWDALSRRWRQRKAVQSVSLFIVDELHLLGGNEGPIMEVVISRMRYLSVQLSGNDESKRSMRMIGLGSSIANAKEVGEWMGVPSKSLFNFSPKVRPVPLDISIQSFDVQNFSARLLAMAKPLYNTVIRMSGNKPVLVFVPSRRQAQLTAIDLMTYRQTLGLGNFLGDGVSAKWISEKSLMLKEATLQQVVSAGIGFLYDGMDDEDWKCVSQLYRERVLQILVCPYDLCWKISDSAHLVVVMGTESYDGREKRYVNYPIGDLLQMMGKAIRPSIDAVGKCVIFCHTPKKGYLKKLLVEPLPIESHLDHHLHDHVNSEIVTKTIRSMQDAVDYITWTFLYRRLTKNPSYYNLQGTSSSQISEHISDMVETVIGDLSESKCCELDEKGDISPLNLGMIAAYYYIQYTTVELMASSVTSKTKIRGIMEILSAATEFSSLPVRHGEEKTLAILSKTLPHQLPAAAQFNDPNTKALVLLQCHFSRKSLSIDLQADQKKVVGEITTLIQAIVDVISSNGWLKPALAAMELCQMVVQALWNKDHVLMQIPHFTKEIIDRCLAYNSEEPVESVLDILSLDDEVRNDLLRLPEEKMVDVATFCNNYPANIEINFEVKDPDDVTAGNLVTIAVSIEREADETEEYDLLGQVSAPFYPKAKQEGWWIVVGDTKTNTLLSIKRVALQLTQKLLMEFIAPEEPGDYNLTLFCMSDSYLGCDQEYSLPLSVAAAESDLENGDSDEGNDDDEEE